MKKLLMIPLLALAAIAAKAQYHYDVNNDGVVNGTDITLIANYILTDGTDAASEAGLCPDANHPHTIDMGAAGHWACCNVGASTPFEYGGYYAWGETEEKSDYSEETYRHYNDGAYVALADFSGDRQYDAATAKWGCAWRTPTFASVKLLLDCSNEWTTMGGVKGHLFTATNGNRLFLPAAGSRNGTELYDAGFYGYYWSSTPTQSISHYAYDLEFYADGADWYGRDRSYGRSVRPVAE